MNDKGYFSLSFNCLFKINFSIIKNVSIHFGTYIKFTHAWNVLKYIITFLSRFKTSSRKYIERLIEKLNSSYFLNKQFKTQLYTSGERAFNTSFMLQMAAMLHIISSA